LEAAEQHAAALAKGYSDNQLYSQRLATIKKVLASVAAKQAKER
jgi:hypothetical protein